MAGIVSLEWTNESWHRERITEWLFILCLVSNAWSQGEC